MDSEDINELSISYGIAWYEQKAVAVLLTTVSWGKGNRLVPTLSAFLLTNIAKVLAEKFDNKHISTIEEDSEAMMLSNSSNMS